MTRFRRWTRDALATHPAPDGKPVRVVLRAPADGALAQAHRGDHIWSIFITPGLPDQFAWVLFQHELAHVHAWDDDDPLDHSDCGDPACRHWGCAMARLEREHGWDRDHAA